MWLRRRIRDTGGAFYKFVSPGNDGVPDRICILPGGQIIFVELKAEAGELSPVQDAQIRKLRGLGCRVEMVRGMDGARRFFDAIRAT
jgi:hypothetical protein